MIIYWVYKLYYITLTCFESAVDAAIEALHPVGRLGSPEDVANTVFWLASSDAAFVTGQEVVVDGGRLAKLPLPAL